MNEPTSEEVLSLTERLRRQQHANEALAYLEEELERMRREAVGLLAQIESFERAVAALKKERVFSEKGSGQ